MDIYIESMTRAIFRPRPWIEYNVRVWRQEEQWTETCSKECELEVLSKLSTLPVASNQYDMAIAIIELDRVNAVEVLNELGDGPVLYKNWP